MDGKLINKKQSLIAWIRLFLCLELAGCAIIPNQRVATQVRPFVESYLQTLKYKNYDDSYAYFSNRLKSEISLTQHTGFMKIVEEELGGIQSWKLIYNPLRFSIFDEEAFTKAFRHDSDYLYYLYKVKFSKDTAQIVMHIVKENGEFKVDVFGVAGDKFYYNEKLQERVKALGIEGRLR